MKSFFRLMTSLYHVVSLETKKKKEKRKEKRKKKKTVTFLFTFFAPFFIMPPPTKKRKLAMKNTFIGLKGFLHLRDVVSQPSEEGDQDLELEGLTIEEVLQARSTLVDVKWHPEVKLPGRGPYNGISSRTKQRKEAAEKVWISSAADNSKMTAFFHKASSSSAPSESIPGNTLSDSVAYTDCFTLEEALDQLNEDCDIGKSWPTMRGQRSMRTPA